MGHAHGHRAGCAARCGPSPTDRSSPSHFAPQTQTSWSLIYTTLKAAFGEQNYHQATTLVKIDQDLRAGTVTAQFEDGREALNLASFCRMPGGFDAVSRANPWLFAGPGIGIKYSVPDIFPIADWTFRTVRQYMQC